MDGLMVEVIAEYWRCFFFLMDVALFFFFLMDVALFFFFFLLSNHLFSQPTVISLHGKTQKKLN